MLSCGIIGLPNAGKSTLFNALTRAAAPVASYPFTTIEPNVGIVEMRDERLRRIAEAVHPAKTVSAAIKFVDIAGLVKDAHKGEGLGNQFLGQIREVDAIVHVIRCFTDPNVAHVAGELDPIRDKDSVNLELIFADLETLDRRIGKIKKPAESGIKDAKHEFELLAKTRDALQTGIPVKKAPLSGEDMTFLQNLSLLTAKPEIYIANVSEEQIASPGTCLVDLKKKAMEDESEVVAICAKLESDLGELSEEEAKEYLAETGIDQTGLDRLIKAAYGMLNLITFFTAEPNEARSWPIPQGSTAYQAAGQIHTDMQRGFIKAEVVNWKELVEAGSFGAAREAGKMLLEGKEYGVKDGDVIHFKFNV